MMEILFAILAAALPADRETVPRADLAAIVAGDEYPPRRLSPSAPSTSTFSSFGQDFTQVVVILTPDKPRLHAGRKLVVVGGEPGSEYAGDFLETPEGQEGPGVWLAKRGVTFVALTRVGRWNFLATDGLVGRRSGRDAHADVQPQQNAHWSAADYEVKSSGVQGATSGDSAVYRVRRPARALQPDARRHALTYLTGYSSRSSARFPGASAPRLSSLLGNVHRRRLPLSAREAAPARRLPGLGHEQHRLAYVYRRAKSRRFQQPYAQSALRVRERGLDDFTYYTKELGRGDARSRGGRTRRRARASRAARTR
jgi:hypothetical protein